MRDLSALLPPLDADYRGSARSRRFLTVLTVVTTVRSLIHVAAPDGGARSIAKLDVDGPQGKNLVALFGQWGLEQLLLAGVSWVILRRYRSLIPFALLLHVLDLVGRIGVGRMKPIVVERPPPGAIGQVVVLPPAAIALWFSLPPHD
jgi:hypothetical protein